MRALLGLLPIFATGCMLWPGASTPTLGAKATGEPLLIVDDVKVETKVTRDKVGELRVEDDAGQTVARGDLYANQRHTTAQLVWFPVQGSEVIPDEDFFRIAGDPAAVERSRARRERLQSWNRRGKIIALAGVAGVIGGIFVPNPAKTLLVLGGGAAFATGWYVSFWSHQQVKPEHHAVEREEAVMAAQRYNKTLGISASRSF
jgi:hypothetical protein